MPEQARDTYMYNKPKTPEEAFLSHFDSRYYDRIANLENVADVLVVLLMMSNVAPNRIILTRLATALKEVNNQIVSPTDTPYYVEPAINIYKQGTIEPNEYHVNGITLDVNLKGIGDTSILQIEFGIPDDLAPDANDHMLEDPREIDISPINSQ